MVAKTSPTSAAVAALALLREPCNHLCRRHRHRLVNRFSHEIFLQLLEDSRSPAPTASTAPSLLDTLTLVFSSVDQLSQSFLHTDAQDLGPESLSALDVDSVVETYQLIGSLNNPTVTRAVMNGIESFFRTEIVGKMRMTRNPLVLRPLVICLFNPALEDPEYLFEITLPLCRTIASLPKHLPPLIAQLLAGSPHHLARLLGMLQQVLTIQLVGVEDRASDGPLIIEKDNDTMAIIKCMNIIYLANCELPTSSPDLVPYDQFYNEIINARLHVTSSLSRLFNHKPSVFAFHFLLNTRNKSQLFRLEAVISQQRHQNDARESLMGYRFGRTSSSATSSDGYFDIPALRLELHLRRSHLRQDAINWLNLNNNNLKKELKISFTGEEGVDAGGVQKEFFQLLLRELFDPSFGMFYADPERNDHWFTQPITAVSDDGFGIDEESYELIGKLIGIAIYNGIILDLHFPIIVYKYLVEGFHAANLTIDDLIAFSPMLGRSLQQLLDFQGDVEHVFGLDFTASYNPLFGLTLTHELVPGGASIPVTNDNRAQFVELYIQYLLRDSIRPQFDAFSKGFFLVCDTQALRKFHYRELEMLICGSQVLDFHELEAHTKYDGLSKNDQVVRWFWEVAHQFSESQKRLLLSFATGSDRSPVGGLKDLGFVIAKAGGEPGRLPTASTCFNVLLLPLYASKDDLERALLLALDNAEGFGLM